MKQKIKKLLILCCMFGLVFGTVTIQAKAANTTQEQKIKYKVKKVKKKVLMLPGETRMVSTTIPLDSVFESSNPKVVGVTGRGQMIAQKAGTAKITHISGNVKTIYTVKVNKEVDLIVFAGQSNMCGSGGNSAQAPEVPLGTAYELDMTKKTYATCILREPFGEGANRDYGLQVTGNYSKKGTIASAFCINYYKQTKTPVVGIMCAWGGSSTNTWLNRGLLSKTQSSIKKAKKELKKKKIKVRHVYMVWYQGESDAMQGNSASTYISRMKKIYKKVKKVGVEKIFVIRIGHDMTSPDKDYTIMKAQEKLCKSNKNFIMVSKKAAKFRTSSYKYYYDSIHLNQKALNAVGYEAGKAAGKYVKKQSKKKK